MDRNCQDLTALGTVQALALLMLYSLKKSTMVLRGHPGVQKRHRAPITILAVKLCYVFHSQPHQCPWECYSPVIIYLNGTRRGIRYDRN